MEIRYWILVAAIFVNVAPAVGAPIDGAWIGNIRGIPFLINFYKRANAELVGYVASHRGVVVTDADDDAGIIKFSLKFSDPSSSSQGDFVGTIAGPSISGDYTDSAGTVSVTFNASSAAYKTEYWEFSDSSSGKVAQVSRVRLPATFYRGGTVGVTDCSFLGCKGDITSWTSTALNHTIDISSTAGTHSLTGTYDPATWIVSGTNCLGGTCAAFSGQRFGYANTPGTAHLLKLLADFADDIEAEDATGIADHFASLYVNQGTRKADIVASLEALFTSYDNFVATIEEVSLVISHAESNIPSTLDSYPRIGWKMSVTAEDSFGVRSTVLSIDASSADSSYFWAEISGSPSVARFIGDGELFSIVAPYELSSEVDEMNPFVTGGHNGLDMMPSGSTLAIVAPYPGIIASSPDPGAYWCNNGTVNQYGICVGGKYQVNVRISHSRKYMTELAFEPFSDSPTDGASQVANILVTAGQEVEAGTSIGNLFMVGADTHVHFTFAKNGSAICPALYFDTTTSAQIVTKVQARHPTATDMCQ